MLDNPDISVRLSGLSKRYLIYARPMDRLLQGLWRGRRSFFHEHEALKPIDLEVRKGETLGIVGVNGSGKSTLLQMICGTLQPTTGTCETHGRISALLELGAGFNPEFSGRENILLNAAILGLSREEIEAKYDGIVTFSGLDPDMLERPVKTYSSGMYVRLAFAVAIAVEPDILIVDEALAVGDEAFQRKCYARIRDLQAKGATILFVSHSARTVTDLCSRAILLDQGEMILQDSPKEVMEQYHRLIFAPVEHQSAIRHAIREGRGTSDTVEAAGPPESSVAYVPAGGEILLPELLDAQGRPTGFLVSGEAYCFRYRVRVTEPLSQPRFAMLIKTKTGQELAGAVLQHAMAQAEPGLEMQVEFRFIARFCQGSYFMNCGVLAQHDEGERFVHRILDAVQFQVLPPMDEPERPVMPTAIIDLSAEASLTELSAPASLPVG